MAQETVYLTTSIPYVNGSPHLGHAMEFILTDALARYHRLRGDDVRFLTGTDENSLKNVQAAEKAGLPIRTLVDRYAAQFYALRDALNLSFDDFIRTSVDPRHAGGVHKLWQTLDERGDIYKQWYRGLYCVGCEQFYTADELEAGLCPEHRTPPELVEEENYFFRLSRYADRLYHLITSGALQVEPATRRNEMLAFIRKGLTDFSISRSQARAHGWGIPVPDDPEQVMYVWFDALGNYITALGYADEGPLYRRYWLENPRRIHVIGKGIARFHVLYWPAMLLSAGVPLPTTVFVHGYVTVDGQKIGKSLGNAVDPVALAERYGVGALRHYLLREVRSTEDGDFTLGRFIRSYHTHLADQLGNLLRRVVSMVQRYYGGIVPAAGEPDDADRRLIATAEGVRGRIEMAMAAFAPHDALAAVWDGVGVANRYVVEVEPWTLAKRRDEPEAAARLATVLYNLVETLRLAALWLAPFLPGAAQTMAEQLGLPVDAVGGWEQATRWGGYPPGATVRGGAVLFPRIEESPQPPR